MKPDIIKDEILDILESLKEQIPVLTSYTDKIPQIELDIVLSNLRRIYENVQELKNFVQEKETHIKTEKSLDVETIEKVQSDSKISGEEIKPEPAIDEEKQEKDKIAEEEESKIIEKENEREITEPVNPVREPVKIVFESKEEEIIQPRKKQIKEKSTIDLFSSSQTTSIADKFKDVSKSVNEKILSEKEDKSIAAKMQKEQITDLKLAIGLNEKFLFINELFDGNMKEYTEAVDKLNSAESYENTMQLFEEIKNKYKWDETSDAYKKFLDLLKRKS